MDYTTHIRCGNCQEAFPATEKYFKFDPDKANKLSRYCKKCTSGLSSAERRAKSVVPFPAWHPFEPSHIPAAIYAQVPESVRFEKNENAGIYILVDPRNSRVFYVGASVDLKNRYYTHLKQARDVMKVKTPAPVRFWLAGLLSSNQKPIMVKVDDYSLELERQWIIKLYEYGAPLTNVTHVPTKAPEQLRLIA